MIPEGLLETWWWPAVLLGDGAPERGNKKSQYRKTTGQCKHKAAELGRESQQSAVARPGHAEQRAGPGARSGKAARERVGYSTRLVHAAGMPARGRAPPKDVSIVAPTG